MRKRKPQSLKASKPDQPSHQFTDTRGRPWTIALNVHTVEAIRDQLSLDLLAPTPDLMQRLAADPIQLVGVLAVALADDLSAAAETPEGFARSLGGDAIGNAPVKSFADLIKTNEPELARLRKQQAEAIAAAGPVAQTAIAKVSGSDVSGTFSAEAARGLAASTVQEKQLVEATAPTIFQGLRRKNDFNIARNGRANLSKVTVNYAQSDDPTKMKLSFEIGGGSDTVKQSLESLRSYSSDNRKARGNGQNQADFQGAIYVSNNGVAGVDVVNEGHRGIELYLDITTVSGTSPTLDIKLQGKDETSGKYFDVPGAAFAQKTGTGQATLTIYPGIAESANVSVSDILAGMFRFVATIGGTDTPTFTFSLGANLKPSGNTGGGCCRVQKTLQSNAQTDQGGARRDSQGLERADAPAAGR